MRRGRERVGKRSSVFALLSWEFKGWKSGDFWAGPKVPFLGHTVNFWAQPFLIFTYINSLI